MSEKTLTLENFLQQLEASWSELTTYLASLTEDQLTRPIDSAGWTVKDHIIHIAIWEKAELALLDAKSKREAMNITPEIWEQDDDPINAVIQQRYQDIPLDEVMQTLNQTHDQLLAKIDSMTEADLLRPYHQFNATSTDERPMLEYMFWDTVYHYRDHLPWMKAIADKA